MPPTSPRVRMHPWSSRPPLKGSRDRLWGAITCAYGAGMDRRRVLIFRDVARAGSISGAARELGWTQPAVSQHLRALERSVGSPLLVRTSTGVELTEPGRVLLARADDIAAQLHMAAEELADLATLRR